MIINPKFETLFVPICIGSKAIQIGISITDVAVDLEDISSIFAEREGVSKC